MTREEALHPPQQTKPHKQACSVPSVGVTNSLSGTWWTTISLKQAVCLLQGGKYPRVLCWGFPQ